MSKRNWNLYWRGPANWRSPFKVYCAKNGISIQRLMAEAMADIAKKKGIKVPS